MKVRLAFFVWRKVRTTGYISGFIYRLSMTKWAAKRT